MTGSNRVSGGASRCTVGMKYRQNGAMDKHRFERQSVEFKATIDESISMRPSCVTATTSARRALLLTVGRTVPRQLCRKLFDVSIRHSAVRERTLKFENVLCVRAE